MEFRQQIKHLILRLVPDYVREHEEWRDECAALREKCGSQESLLREIVNADCFPRCGVASCLVVDSNLPMFDKDAGSRTINSYVCLFRDMGLDVTVFSETPFKEMHVPYWMELHRRGINVAFRHAEQSAQDVATRTSQPFSFILLSRPDTAAGCIEAIKAKSSSRILYYGHDLHWLRNQRAFEMSGDAEMRRQAEAYKVMESRIASFADVTMFPSQCEVDAMRAVQPAGNYAAIPPYIYDITRRASTPAAARCGHEILFVGSESHTPNADGLRWFIAEILPRVRQAIPDATLHVVGMSRSGAMADAESEFVTLEGRVSDEELAKFYGRCRLSIAPLRYGAGVKGKVVEAIFHGIASVTTTIGAEGLPEAGSVLSIADTPEEFARHAIALLDASDATLEEIATKSAAYIQRHFSRERAEAALRKILGM